MRRNMEVHPKHESDYIVGRNAVKEAIKSGRSIDSIMVSSFDGFGSIKAILAQAKDKGIVIKQVNKKVLNSISDAHQGIIAVAAAKESCTIDDILNLAHQKNEQPFVIVADGIEDPHNLGAIIRTAECVGAHGIIIPKRRAVGMTGAVDKSSAGALQHMLVAKVGNISLALNYLKDQGLWIYGTDAQGTTFTKENLQGSVALVIGSEGKGISAGVKEKCDFMLSIPMKGRINSLNASVAAGVLMYEVYRQRNSV